MAPARARASNEVGAHALGVLHERLQRLVPALQPVADLLKAPACGCLDLAARLAKHQPYDVFGHLYPSCLSAELGAYHQSIVAAIARHRPRRAYPSWS